MAIEAPVSKFRKNTLIIWIVVCMGFAAYCVYDGFYSEKFINKHTDSEGNPDSTLVFNQKAPPYLIGAALLLGAYLFAIKNKKLTADDNKLIITANKAIAYEAIQKIDKTHYDSKGYFTVTYEDEKGQKKDCRLSDKSYDNLAAILELLVAKIS